MRIRIIIRPQDMCQCYDRGSVFHTCTNVSQNIISTFLASGNTKYCILLCVAQNSAIFSSGVQYIHIIHYYDVLLCHILC